MVNKTAIQWLYEQYRKEAIPTDAITELFREAERMEKEQIKDAWNTRSKIDGVITFTDNRTAEEYYNETFKSE